MEILQSHFEVELKTKGWVEAISIWVEDYPEGARTFYRDNENRLVEFSESEIENGDD